MFVVTFVNTTAFFFREGVWRHGIFVSRRTENKRDTRVSRKSGLIQPVRWWLRHSWSVSRKVCHMHQTFSQRSVGVTSEADTNSDLAQVPSIVCVYRSSSDSTLRGQFLVWVLYSSSSSRSLVTSCFLIACFLIISLSWIIPLPCCFGLCLHLAWNITCLYDYPFAQPSGLCSLSFDPRLSLDHSFILPTTYLSGIV